LTLQLRTFSFPPCKAARDAVHLVVATAIAADYLLTWNCRHLANAQILKRLEREAQRVPIEDQGAWLDESHLHRQTGQDVLLVENLISAGTWRGPIDELIPIGPLQVRVKLPAEARGRSAQLLVAGRGTPVAAKDGWATFEVKSILDHEVVVVT
jgi:hypothetical protein